VALLDPIWRTAYQCVANCNNLLGNIRNEDASKFQSGELEKGLIIGEAMAMRAMLQFDILRLYAPYADDGKAWVPYYDQDGLSTGAPLLTVTAVLDKVVADLTEAQQLTENYDLRDDGHVYMLGPNSRFTVSFANSGMDDTERSLFIAARGYRMNYFAVTALLARVYSWRGEHEKANAEADKILNFEYNEQAGIMFGFVSPTDARENRKTTDDLIFCLADGQLYDHYQPYTSHNTGGREDPFLSLSYDVRDAFSEWYGGDPADYRYTVLTGVGSASQRVSLKYSRPATESDRSSAVADILPMIRLSELYLIKAEYEASQGLWQNAANALDAIRVGRNCTAGGVDVTDSESFRSALLGEARREFVAEGQTYFYFKKFGETIGWSMQPEHFVFPKPIAENVQI
jgi:hypothetical protein